MRAAEQWERMEAELGPEWDSVHLSFTPEGSTAVAAAILAPLAPGRVGRELRLHVEREGSSRERLRNLLSRLDSRRVWGTLSVLESTRARPAVEVQPPAARSLVDAWDDAVARLAPDWSDLLCELELDSSDHLPRAALLGAPMNPTRNPEATALRFRVSGKQGYGVAPGMVRRCLARMDADGITGRISLLGELSDTENADTQGTVWRLAGRSV